MAKNNALNNNTQELTIDPGASGDSFVQFDINATGEFRIGVDDDDGDAFKLSQGSALGTSDMFIMSAAGERTMPLQPAALSYLDADADNKTGAGATYTVGADTLTEVFDQGGDMTTGGSWAAPVTGRYLLIFNLRVEDLAAAMTEGFLSIVTSNRTYSGAYINCGGARDASNNITMTMSTIADMDSSDTATFTVTVSNGAGDDCDITGAATVLTYINACLLV